MKRSGRSSGAGRSGGEDRGQARKDPVNGRSGGRGPDIIDSDTELKQIRSILESIPEIRMEKVRKIKELVESGDYKIRVEKVAEKMIERSLRNALSTRKRCSLP